MVKSPQSISIRGEMGSPVSAFAWQAALKSAGWLFENEAAGDVTPELNLSAADSSVCLLEQVASSNCVQSSVRTIADHLRKGGMTLRFGWPYRTASKEWLGNRLVYGHSRHFAKTARLASIVSSRLGRNAQRQPRWSYRLDRVLQEVARTDQSLLISHGTTLARPLVHFSRQANIQRCIVQAAADRQTLPNWLRSLFDAKQNWEQTPDPELILLSPEVCESRNEYARAPIRDRVAVGMADQVYGLHLRGNGNISELLQRRLRSHSQNFRLGSTRILLDQSEQKHLKPKQQEKAEKALNQWMKLGAVVWLLQTNQDDPEQSSGELNRLGCKQQCLNPRFREHICVQQPVLPLRAFTQSSQHVERFLVHCTRGGMEASPRESSVAKLTETWRLGEESSIHPFSTLVQIASEARLRSSSQMTRGPNATISLSNVPVDELLARRSFQPHLGRWDWEPYGLLVRRDVLCEHGARPVVYGNEDDFMNLPPEDQAYFQPKLRSDGSQTNWECEQEWRYVGDLRLQSLPREAVYLFTRTYSQAQFLASRFPWACIYVES
ncbi:MAG: hypothetical protein AB8B50_16020 [Pirellulaceae bacterium]